MDDNKIDNEQEELENTENLDESDENNETDVAAETDPEESEEEQEEISSEMTVQETINISMDDISMSTNLNELGLIGFGILIVIFFLATMSVLGKE